MQQRNGKFCGCVVRGLHSRLQDVVHVRFCRITLSPNKGIDVVVALCENVQRLIPKPCVAASPAGRRVQLDSSPAAARFTAASAQPEGPAVDHSVATAAHTADAYRVPFTPAIAPARPFAAVAPHVLSTMRPRPTRFHAGGRPPGACLSPRRCPHGPRRLRAGHGPLDRCRRGEFASFDQIVRHESGWNPHAMNASSRAAYGLGQALPGGKMSAAGGDWRSNPMTQIRWTYNYMNSRYGSPERRMGVLAGTPLVLIVA